MFISILDMFQAAMCPSSGELIVSVWHLVYVTLYRCHIDTIHSPDGGHVAARNMSRIEINIHDKELCVKLVICKDYTEMHSHQNMKCWWYIKSCKCTALMYSLFVWEFLRKFLFYSLLVCLHRNKCTLSILCSSIIVTVLQSSGLATLYVSVVRIVTRLWTEWLMNCSSVPGRVKSV